MKTKNWGMRSYMSRYVILEGHWPGPISTLELADLLIASFQLGIFHMSLLKTN